MDLTLTKSQRAELAAIKEEYGFEVYRRDLRPGDKTAANKQRQRLEALADAWDTIDHDTQMHIVVSIARHWADDAALPPNVGDLLRVLSKDMAMPTGAPEPVPGLRRASLLLWRVWCEGQNWKRVVEIDRSAVSAIGAEVAELFGLSAAEAGRRVRNALREMDKANELPRRKGYGS